MLLCSTVLLSIPVKSVKNEKAVCNGFFNLLEFLLLNVVANDPSIADERLYALTTVELKMIKEINDNVRIGNLYELYQ